MNCNITMFKGFTGTIPIYEASDLYMEEVLSLMAGELIHEAEKSRVPYATPITFNEAPYIGQTAERMLKHGHTSGVQRSARHAQNCQAGNLVFDFDELMSDQTATALQPLEQTQGFAYTSHSHGKPDKVGSSFRLILGLDKPVSGIEEYQKCWLGVERTFFPDLADFSSSKPYQMQGCWSTAPERSNLAWRRTNIRAGQPLSTEYFLSVGLEAIKQSPFGRAGIIARACVSPVESHGLNPEVALAPILETPEQYELLDALCMLDPTSTELMIQVFGCLKAIDDHYQGHFESWVASNPEAVEKYRRKHPTKYNPRHMWTQTNWRASIGPECGFATIKSLARASAWMIVEEDNDANAVDVALAYLDRYHHRWLLERLGGK